MSNCTVSVEMPLGPTSWISGCKSPVRHPVLGKPKLSRNDKTRSPVPASQRPAHQKPARSPRLFPWSTYPDEVSVWPGFVLLGEENHLKVTESLGDN